MTVRRIARRRSTVTVDDVDIRVKFAGIYSHRLVEVEATSHRPFDLTLKASLTVNSIDFGTQLSPTEVRAMEDGPIFRITLSVLGAFAQLPVLRKGDLRFGIAPGARRTEYGIRFFPFASSVLRLHFSVGHRRIASFVVNNDADTRVLWSSAVLTDDHGRQLPRQVSNSPEGWKESLAWLSPAERPHEVHLQVPVRANGRSIASTVLRPMFLWTASLAGILLAVELADRQVVIASVVGTWSFILREWSSSARAHQWNFYSAILAIQAIFAGLWAAVLELRPDLLWITIAVLVLFSADLMFAATRFEYRGRLPRHMGLPWAVIARALEARRAWQRRRMRVHGFDWEPALGQDVRPRRK